MDTNKVSDALEKLFLEERIVFWNDPEKEFVEYLSGQLFSPVAGVEVIRLDQTGAFATKLKIERGQPDTKFLVYTPAEEPDPNEDWLLDIRFYSHSFRADRASIVLNELGLQEQQLRDHLGQGFDHMVTSKVIGFPPLSPLLAGGRFELRFELLQLYEGDDFPMLQCVWPDQNHHYPWEPECDPEIVACQPIFSKQAGWAFRNGKNLAVFTTKFVIEKGYPILLVSHDKEDDWQFLCGTTSKSADCRVVSLGSIVESDPSVVELADLPLGWQAFRDEPGQPWVREKDE